MKHILFLIAAVPAIACPAPPKPTQSEYLVTTGGGFQVTRNRGVYYSMSYRVIKDLPAGYRLVFTFENPRKGLPGIAKTQDLQVDGSEISVRSPYLECIRNRRKYRVSIDIYADDAQTEKIGRHVQKVEFNMPEAFLRQFGIESC